MLHCSSYAHCQGWEWDQAEALDAGADDYITKPFSYPVLLARLRAVLRRSSSHSSSLLNVGDLSLDTGSRQCCRGEVAISLTPREFDVLYFLLLHVGAVCTKIELLDEVWGVAHNESPNLVDVYISYLRKKIDAPFVRASLKTIRGVGYRLVDDLAGSPNHSGADSANDAVTAVHARVDSGADSLTESAVV